MPLLFFAIYLTTSLASNSTQRPLSLFMPILSNLCTCVSSRVHLRLSVPVPIFCVSCLCSCICSSLCIRVYAPVTKPFLFLPLSVSIILSLQLHLSLCLCPSLRVCYSNLLCCHLLLLFHCGPFQRDALHCTLS